MDIMFNTVSARQIQREYKKVLEDANKSKEPIVVMANNKPQGAIIGLDLLEKIQLEAVLNEALEEYRAGKTISIETDKDLKKHFKEIDKLV
jgi:PHD/YefM family antitoxin component YafN of YafNO toxin-antitoxin module